MLQIYINTRAGATGKVNRVEKFPWPSKCISGDSKYEKMNNRMLVYFRHLQGQTGTCSELK